MESWIRSRSLPVFFAINFFGVLLAVPVAFVVSALMLHDHVKGPAVVESVVMPLVYATIVTSGEASRRRGERAAR